MVDGLLSMGPTPSSLRKENYIFVFVVIVVGFAAVVIVLVVVIIITLIIIIIIIIKKSPFRNGLESKEWHKQNDNPLKTRKKSHFFLQWLV